MLRQGLYRSDAAAPDGDGDVRTLFVASSCMRLRYFGRQPTAEPAQWHDLWQQADALPDLVELRLTDGDPSLGPVRSMVVAPRLRPSP